MDLINYFYSFYREIMVHWKLLIKRYRLSVLEGNLKGQSAIPPEDSLEDNSIMSFSVPMLLKQGAIGSDWQ